MKKKMLFLLSFGLLLIMACAVAEPTTAPVTVPTSAPALNTPRPQQPVPQNPTAPLVAATSADAGIYNVQLEAGASYDFDTFSAAQNATVDFSLSSDAGLMQPQNGAQMSGYADLSPFEKSECQAAVMSTEPLAWQSDLYICFKTNQGRYGYIVIREGASDAIWFDAYLFP